MSFLSLLFAFLLEQVRPLASGHSLEKAFHAWADWLKNNLDAGDRRHAWTAWWVAVGVPCLTVVAVHWWLIYAMGWVFAMLWNLAVLYATLGFRRFSHHFTGIRDALATGDDVAARELLRQWQGGTDASMTRTEIIRHVIEHSALAAHRHVFGVVAWFSLLAAVGLGPVGALMFRLSALLSQAWGERSTEVDDGPHISEARSSVSATAWYWVDWLPSRLTAVSFAVVGNFEDAVDAWRQQADQFQQPNDGVVLAATSGAINVRLGGTVLAPDEPPELAGISDMVPPTAGREPEFAHLRSMVGLVWRAVVMWMFLLALLTLARMVG